MAKPIAIIFNDAHLKPGNEKEVLTSVRSLFKHAVSFGIKDLIFAGDLFDSRSFQKQEVLRTFDIILQECESAGLTMHLFPGNHDKTIYKDEYSFLDIFRYHPCVKFNRTTKNIKIKGVSITLMPFFSDEVLVPMINEAKGGDVLISHFEMGGSTNLGKVSEKASITREMLKKWKKTYLGHYHNYHEITKDIVHLPSLRQASFGEDSIKGFTVLNDDLNYELVKGDFREYVKVIIDLDKMDSKKISSLVNEYKNNENSIRFEIIGEDSKLKSFNKEQFKGTGIDVKIKYGKVFNKEITTAPNLVERYDKGQIEETFEEFCISKGYSYEEGRKFLVEYFNKK